MQNRVCFPTSQTLPMQVNKSENHLFQPPKKFTFISIYAIHPSVLGILFNSSMKNSFLLNKLITDYTMEIMFEKNSFYVRINQIKKPVLSLYNFFFVFSIFCVYIFPGLFYLTYCLGRIKIQKCFL